ncbi:MAG: hypothetical protein HGA49_09880 [Eubacteriaceae bacterium]|nr:hypothetical protein [Eubacteriaceae bacterium]
MKSVEFIRRKQSIWAEMNNAILSEHSSAEITGNVFDFWKNREDKTLLAKALNIISKNITEIAFKEVYPILKTSDDTCPTIDVTIKYKNGACCAIESTFSEPYVRSTENDGLGEKYIAMFNDWQHMPNIKKFAQLIAREDTQFDKLHPAHLIKQMLAMMNLHENQKDRFILLYLYYDVPGRGGCQHLDEIEKFSKIIRQDGINFQTLTWQDLIYSLYSSVDKSDPLMNDYITNICKRYL